jgi:hypothetical protein
MFYRCLPGSFAPAADLPGEFNPTGFAQVQFGFFVAALASCIRASHMGQRWRVAVFQTQARVLIQTKFFALTWVGGLLVFAFDNP